MGNTDWKAVYHESEKQAVIIPAFFHYKKLPLGKELKSEIGQSVNQCIQNYSYHDYLHSLLKDHGISYCILKEVVSAHYYPESMMRQMGDADFLVAREDFPKAEEVLKADGFIIHEESHRHHVGFEKDRMSFEIHFDQPGIPDGVEAWVVRDYFSDILEKSKETSDGSFTWIQPDKFHHGLIMLLYVQRHLLSEGIGLRHLCAWAVFVNAIPEQEFQQIFEERLKKIGLWKFAQTISLTAHLGTGLPRKSWMGKDQSIAQALLKDILSGGNFGSKDRQRAWEGMFISSRGQNSVKHNRIMQAIFFNKSEHIQSLADGKEKERAIADWIGTFLFRIVYRAATGKTRKHNLFSAYHKSAGRKKLYRQLELFEGEK